MRRNFRKLLAQSIDSNGGYPDRHDRYLLSWDVPVYSVSVDDIVPALVETGEFMSPADVILRFPHVHKLWESWCADYDAYPELYEDMQDGVLEADTYRMWRPEIARRYGFSYTGLGAEKPFDVKFEFRGRCGKHLCVVEFEGITLKGDARDLLEDVWFSPTWIRQMLGMIDEWDLCFTRKNVEAEARYLTVWRFGQHIQTMARTYGGSRAAAA